MVYMPAQRATEPIFSQVRLFPKILTIVHALRSLSWRFLIKRKVTTSRSNVYRTSWTLTLSSDSTHLILLRFWYFIRITNDCIQDNSYTEAGCSGHHCNWGYWQTMTAIKISSILLRLVLPGTQRYGFNQSVTRSSWEKFFFSRLKRKTKWFVGNCRAVLQSRNSTSREVEDEWPSIDRFLCFLAFKYVIVTLA